MPSNDLPDGNRSAEILILVTRILKTQHKQLLLALRTERATATPVFCGSRPCASPHCLFTLPLGRFAPPPAVTQSRLDLF